MKFHKIVQRPETDRRFPQVVQLQKYYRQSLPPDSLRAAMQEAVRLATEMGMAGFASRPHQPISATPKLKRESPVSPRVKCFEHRVKRHVFQDGSVFMSCAHSECGFGKTTKRHSDGRKYPIPEDLVVPEPVVPELVEIEDQQALEQEEILELGLEQRTLTAGEDDPQDIESDIESDEDGDVERVEDVEPYEEYEGQIE